MNILVTGGSSGLGKSIVEKFCSNKKNKVYFTYNNSIIYGTSGSIIINNPWLPHKKPVLEVISGKHYYKQFVKSELSLYAKQIQMTADSFMKKNEEKNTLFNIDKSIICMSLIEKWKTN